MTIDRKLRAGAILVALAAFIGSSFGCATDTGRRGGLSPERIAALPPNVRDAYDLFAFKCSRCHTLARPLSADITDFEHWRAYVGRMRRHAGSGISEADGEQILVFLKYLTDERIRAAAASREGEKP